VSVSHPNDLDFISTLLDDLKSTLCIDETRIYAAGKSNGGGFTNLLACNATLSANFAAFAAVSGAFYDTDATIGPCDPGRQSTPFLEFHGLNDTTVPYLGKTGTTPARSEYPIPVFMQAWAERNGCPADSPPSRTIPLYDGLVLKEEWDCGGESRVVEHYRENDLGHIWPSTEPNDDCFTMPHQCPDGHYVFNATAVIFDFFGRWTL
jgi:poly(3-hydroxybutyrate) depolymerase